MVVILPQLPKWPPSRYSLDAMSDEDDEGDDNEVMDDTEEVDDDELDNGDEVRNCLNLGFVLVTETDDWDTEKTRSAPGLPQLSYMITCCERRHLAGAAFRTCFTRLHAAAERQ